MYMADGVGVLEPVGSSALVEGELRLDRVVVEREHEAAVGGNGALGHGHDLGLGSIAQARHLAMRQVLEAGNSGVVLRVRVRVSRDLLIGGSSVSHGVGLALRMQDEGGHRPSRQMIGHAVALGGTAVAGIHVAQDIKRQDRAVGLDGPVAVLGRVNENILVNILVDDVAVLIFAAEHHSRSKTGC